MNECLRIFDYGPFHIEQFIVACTGKVDWRSDFMLGLAVVIFVAALFFGLMWMFSKVSR